MDRGWTHKPFHLSQLIQFAGFSCFKCILSKARSCNHYLISSYFFLDEKVSKKSRLKSLEGLTLASRRMLSAISSPHRKLAGQAQYVIAIHWDLSCLFNSPFLLRSQPSSLIGRSFCCGMIMSIRSIAKTGIKCQGTCHGACPYRTAQQVGRGGYRTTWCLLRKLTMRGTCRGAPSKK